MWAFHGPARALQGHHPEFWVVWAEQQALLFGHNA
jgi:hypothetical protein